MHPISNTDIYEFRFYDVADGRMADELSLVYDVAINGAPEVPGGPSMHKQSLWDQYGVPRPVGSWVARIGAQLPAFLYIIKWDSLSQRDELFSKFWSDPIWQARRAELTDGMTLVDSIETWVAKPSAAWEPPVASGATGGVHELRMKPVLAGAQEQAADTLRQCDLPALRSYGAQVLAVLELEIGPCGPMLLTMLAWPDQHALTNAWQDMEADETVIAQPKREIQAFGQPLFGPSQQYVLDPMAWNLPDARFGMPS